MTEIVGGANPCPCYETEIIDTAGRAEKWNFDSVRSLEQRQGKLSLARSIPLAVLSLSFVAEKTEGSNDTLLHRISQRGMEQKSWNTVEIGRQRRDSAAVRSVCDKGGCVITPRPKKSGSTLINGARGPGIAGKNCYAPTASE
ncbi:hypothetical protein K0M31_004701 [Melipona bicolor]|uniref:Uncharacterized protein n=1 Tax=Melipona bicolor TaxID=60889 RepID=A0AA40FXE7_9HYME|nr:hypothetical protein K0M31_004701 [Melipona bicolor]